MKDINQFEALCKLASDETWCWNLCCTTCGHMHFRYAFKELAAGRAPTDSSWIIHSNIRIPDSLGSFPRSYTEEEKEIINKICCEANIATIELYCKFPAWLGYLGLVLTHMYSGSKSYKELSSSWASQLTDKVTCNSPIHARLQDISKGKSLLNIEDLEKCESNIIMHNEAKHHFVEIEKTFQNGGTAVQRRLLVNDIVRWPYLQNIIEKKGSSILKKIIEENSSSIDKL